MAYGTIKADKITYDDGGSDADANVSDIVTKASLGSPAFTGTPTAPTAAASTNTTQLATTAFVQTELGDYQPVDADLTSLSSCQTGAATALALLTSTEVEVLDGVTAGTVSASKAVVVDTNLDITGLNDITAVDLTLSGDLTVNGTMTTIDTTNLVVEDPLIYLARNNSGGDTLDIGFYGRYYPSSTNLWGGLFRDASDSGKWKLFESLESIPTTTVDTSGTGYAAATLVVGTLEDSKGDVRSIPQNTQGSTYTLVAGDAGKHILASGTVTIPNSVFAAGDAVTIVNNTAGDLTITKTITTMYNAADATSASRTLATRGMATILFASGTVAYISGAGLS